MPEYDAFLVVDRQLPPRHPPQCRGPLWHDRVMALFAPEPGGGDLFASRSHLSNETDKPRARFSRHMDECQREGCDREATDVFFVRTDRSVDVCDRHHRQFVWLQRGVLVVTLLAVALVAYGLVVLFA
jgi:hypothetical protein